MEMFYDNSMVRVRVRRYSFSIKLNLTQPLCSGVRLSIPPERAAFNYNYRVLTIQFMIY